MHSISLVPPPSSYNIHMIPLHNHHWVHVRTKTVWSVTGFHGIAYSSYWESQGKCHTIAGVYEMISCKRKILSANGRSATLNVVKILWEIPTLFLHVPFKMADVTMYMYVTIVTDQHFLASYPGLPHFYLPFVFTLIHGNRGPAFASVYYVNANGRYKQDRPGNEASTSTLSGCFTSNLT